MLRTCCLLFINRNRITTGGGRSRNLHAEREQPVVVQVEELHLEEDLLWGFHQYLVEDQRFLMLEHLSRSLKNVLYLSLPLLETQNV